MIQNAVFASHDQAVYEHSVETIIACVFALKCQVFVCDWYSGKNILAAHALHLFIIQIQRHDFYICITQSTDINQRLRLDRSLLAPLYGFLSLQINQAEKILISMHNHLKALLCA